MVSLADTMRYTDENQVRRLSLATCARLLVASVLLLPLVACARVDAPELTGWQELYRRPGWQAGATIDLRAAGDVLLARSVARRAEREGAEEVLAEVRPLLAGDLTLGNLESPLTARHDALRPGPYRLLAPPALVAALPAAGFDLLGLANNHALDAGPGGLADSVETLQRAGIALAGVGQGEAAALAPTMLTAGGLRVAVLAFNDVLDPSDEPAALAPAGDRAWRNPDFARCPLPGEQCPHGRAWLSARALEAVAAARAEADVVVTMVHWGVEYAAEPSLRQRVWAARLVAAGADLVLGAHPHVLQPAVPLAAGGRSGFVAYSLGNLLFDGPADPALNSGAVLRILLDRAGVALVAVAPIATAGGRPQPLEADSPAWGAALAALGAPARSAPTPRPGAPAAAQPGAAAWRWDGTAGQPVAVPADLTLPAHPLRVAADLRGDGRPLWAELDAAGVVTLRDGPVHDAPLVWRNEHPAWRFTRVLAGDPNDDGRIELMLLLWQPDERGALRSQPYLLGWRGGRFQVIWGGSATAMPIQDLAWADLDADGRGELVVLEGGVAPGDPGEHVSLWRWHGWGFELAWRSPAGRWCAVALADLQGNGGRAIVAASCAVDRPGSPDYNWAVGTSKEVRSWQIRETMGRLAARARTWWTQPARLAPASRG